MTQVFTAKRGIIISDEETGAQLDFCVEWNYTITEGQIADDEPPTRYTKMRAVNVYDGHRWTYAPQIAALAERLIGGEDALEAWLLAQADAKAVA